MSNATNTLAARCGAPFTAGADCAWEPTDPGVRRQILAYGPEVMLVRVVFEAGAIGPEHRHPHVQCSLVESGSFEITIDGRTETLDAGDSFYVPGNVLHGAKALTAGSLIDTFSPMREEFIRKG
jgi:quercetin dioxygenase-like cupin family protein